jgi:hypothetical protein
VGDEIFVDEDVLIQRVDSRERKPQWPFLFMQL